MRTSGSIHLIGKQEFLPDSEGIVYIDFFSSDLLRNNFNVGSSFTFVESDITLGEGVVKEIL